MKLGSIVGIVVSCLLIVAGIVMCFISTSTADNNGQYLFTRIDENGTYYNQKIEDGTMRLKISYENADIKIVGGAERSQIEFRNFNPNLYSLSVTPTVISFEEMQSFTSIVNIGENGINFKGLRYALDFRNDDYDDLPKSIVISLADDCGIKAIDITAAKSTAAISDITLDGDFSLRIDSGKITVDNVTTTSTFELSGNDLGADIALMSAATFRYTSKKSELNIEEISASTSVINVEDGTVNYSTTDQLDGALTDISSESGVLTVNSVPKSEGISNTPSEYSNSLTIKCKSADIDLRYPELSEGGNNGNEVIFGEATPEVAE